VYHVLLIPERGPNVTPPSSLKYFGKPFQFKDLIVELFSGAHKLSAPAIDHWAHQLPQHITLNKKIKQSKIKVF